MVRLDSTRAIILTTRMAVPQQSAETSTRTAPRSSCTMPGRSTTRTPEKPTTRARTRRTRSRSPRMNGAIAVANNGAEKSRATALDSGVKLMARKKVSIEITCSVPRRTCSPIRRVRSGSSPTRIKNGMNTRRPNSERKNPISKGCRSWETRRTHDCMPAKERVAITRRAMPRAVGGTLATQAMSGRRLGPPIVSHRHPSGRRRRSPGSTHRS